MCCRHGGPTGRGQLAYHASFPVCVLMSARERVGSHEKQRHPGRRKRAVYNAPREDERNEKRKVGIIRPLGSATVQATAEVAATLARPPGRTRSRCGDGLDSPTNRDRLRDP